MEQRSNVTVDEFNDSAQETRTVQYIGAGGQTPVVYQGDILRIRVIRTSEGNNAPEPVAGESHESVAKVMAVHNQEASGDHSAVNIEARYLDGDNLPEVFIGDSAELFIERLIAGPGAPAIDADQLPPVP